MTLVRRVEAGKLRSPRAFVRYTSLVTRGCLLEFVLRRARVTSRGRRDERGLSASVEELELLAADGIDIDLLLQLERSLTRLPPRTRLVLERIYLRGCTYEETARELCLTLGTLKRVQTQGLRKLRELFELNSTGRPIPAN